MYFLFAGFFKATDGLITEKAAGWKVLEEQLGLCCAAEGQFLTV